MKVCVILTLLYARDILYIQTVHYVHTVCINNKRWSAAAQYGEIALPAFKQYYGPRTGVVAALLVRYTTADVQIVVDPGSLAPRKYHEWQNLFVKNHTLLS